jgi:pyruvate,water dikinase
MWVRSFKELDASCLPLAGGKAANLGELTRAGFPVPPGFCVLTTAYEAATEVLDLGAVAAEPSAANARALRERIMQLPPPPEVLAAVAEAYRALGPDVPVAVRSSATAEDLPGASFAGQQDTYLDMVGEAAVLDAVRRCWASLWTERAVSYRANQGIDPHGVAIAVVVQVMADAHVAGVLFTADPVSGKRGRAVVDASWGLGEAIVSGEVNPDHWVVEPATGHVLERRLGDKHVAVRRGGRREQLPDGSATPCLADAQLAELARLGQRVEAHYGNPQDLEFAFDQAGTLWLLQARPITTLYPLPAEPRPGLRAYFSFNVAQGVLGPITPMGVEFFRLLAAGVGGRVGVPMPDGPPIFREAGSRLFLDLTGALTDPVGRKLALELMPHMEARSALIVEQLLTSDFQAGPGHGTLLKLAGIAHRSGIPQGVLKAWADPAGRRALALGTAPLVLEGGRLPPDATPAQRIDAFERMVRGAGPLLVERVMPAFIAGVLAGAIAGRLLGAKATTAELQTARRALPYNPTTEMDLELSELRTEEDLAAFLAKYGHRGVAEIDIGVPRWREDPSGLRAAMRNLGQVTDAEKAPRAQFRRAEAEAQAMVAELTRRGGPLVGFLLGRMRELAGLRELPKVLGVMLIARGRELLGPLWEPLGLEAPEDVYFLRLAELRAGGDLRPLVAERKRLYQQERSRRRVPRMLLSDGRMPTADPPIGADGALRGTPASPGALTAPARVVLDPNGAHIEPGEILVAPSTDPAWTPLFLTAGGLVMEMGGAMSHGAVVAREYGIPAVVGVAGAVDRIKTGQAVTVDGTAGLVKVNPPA